jgi:hypothetical protein
MNQAKENLEPIIAGVVKAFATAIPVSAIALSIYEEFQAKRIERKISRLEGFYFSLKDEVSDVEGKINQNYISKDDFGDIFEQTANYIMNERLEEKRKCFQNIFLNSITASSCSYDKTEKYMRLLESMGWLELKILDVLRNPKSYNEKHGNIIKNPNESLPGHINMITHLGPYRGVELLAKLLNEEESEIKDALYYLEQNRLIIEKSNAIQTQTNGHPIHTLDNMLTQKGKDFVLFILK